MSGKDLREVRFQGIKYLSEEQLGQKKYSKGSKQSVCHVRETVKRLAILYLRKGITTEIRPERGGAWPGRSQRT